MEDVDIWAQSTPFAGAARDAPRAARVGGTPRAPRLGGSRTASHAVARNGESASYPVD